MTRATGRGRKLSRCTVCGVQPVAMSGVAYCFTCWPGGPVPTPPCLKCGSRDHYFATGLCAYCHILGDPGVDSCRDCLSWGARRTHNWLCRGCVNWRAKYSQVAACPSCDRTLTLGMGGLCRLCLKQTTMTRKHDPGADPLTANRHGQQLFFADMLNLPGGRPPAPPPAPAPTGAPTPNRPRWLLPRFEQLTLFTIRHDLAAHGRVGLHERADPHDAAILETVLADLVRLRHWNKSQTDDTRIGVRVALSMQPDGRAPVRAGTVECLRDIDLPVRTVLEVLTAADALIEDRTPTFDVWAAARIDPLPQPMATELGTWFTVMRFGSPSPPRRRPRAQQTIRLHLDWALPILTTWAAAGRTSLREITREDVLDALPAVGSHRARAGQGLRSIFRVLKEQKVTFVNPTHQIKLGGHPSRIPLPLDIEAVHALLHSHDPATAVITALIAFHGLRLGPLMRLRLTDIVDGKLITDGRTIPLAEPVRERLATWLTHRNQTWPLALNDHLLINARNARHTTPVGARYVHLHLGPKVTARQLREDRILAEVHATGGDVRTLVDLFGLSVQASLRYVATLDNNDLTPSSPTPGRPPAGDHRATPEFAP